LKVVSLTASFPNGDDFIQAQSLDEEFALTTRDAAFERREQKDPTAKQLIST
jgi:hypothetical protein